MILDVWWRTRIRGRIRRQLRDQALLNAASKDVFTGIYQDNLWGNPESRSGWGSTLGGPNGTQALRAQLPSLIDEFRITSVVDVPCGDLNWLAHLNLDTIDYLGVDIVDDLITTNIQRYASPSRHFKQADLTTWTPPPADLIIVRDLLIHLTNDQAIACLRNVAASGARLLLISNYAKIRRNGDTFAGGLRLHNLMRRPFTEFGIEGAVIRRLPDGDGSRGRQMLLCDISGLHGSQTDLRL